MSEIRLRRSALFMPGSNARAIQKARTLPVDVVILDLEDAVAPESKAQARHAVIDAVRADPFGERDVFVRINGFDTPWGIDDLTAVAAAGPDAIVFPKISTPQQVETIGTRLLDLHAPLHTRVWVMLESPLAIQNALSIAACARDSEARLSGIIVGTNDLAKETGARIVPGRGPMLSWLSACVLAARVHHIAVLDGVYNALSDAEGFARECEQGRDLGFDGKALIHPGQIDPCNAAFSPTPGEIAEAERIVEVFNAPENAGKGAVSLDGRMVERMHADMARRVLGMADAIRARAARTVLGN